METSQKEPFDHIFRPPRFREGRKIWFDIVHWVVLNVFEPFNLYIMMYPKLGLTYCSNCHRLVESQALQPAAEP